MNLLLLSIREIESSEGHTTWEWAVISWAERTVTFHFFSSVMGTRMELQYVIVFTQSQAHIHRYLSIRRFLWLEIQYLACSKIYRWFHSLLRRRISSRWSSLWCCSSNSELRLSPLGGEGSKESGRTQTILLCCRVSTRWTLYYQHWWSHGRM